MKAVVVVDMLNDFVTGPLKCERAPRIIPNIAKLAAAARKSGNLVVFSNDAHRPDDDGEFKIWGPHGIAGTQGAAVIPELAPQSSDFIVPKRRYSGFYATDLQILFQEKHVDTVIITGMHTNICVRHTCSDAFNLGYSIIIPEEAVEAFTEKDQVEGIEYLRKVYGASILNMKETLATFANSTKN